MNALEELNEKKICWSNIIALNISIGNSIGKVTVKYLKGRDDIEKTKEALSKIYYDNDYGLQELFGLILFENGDWLERSEYDGSEWWTYKRSPTIEEVMNMQNDND